MDDKTYQEGLKIINYFAWMRWLSIVFITYVVLHLKYISLFDFPLIPCLIIIIIGALYNYFTPHIASFFKRSNWVNYIYWMGTADMLFATVLIHYTGGVHSSLVYLYFLLVIAGSIFGFTILDYFLSCQLALLFMGVCSLEAYGFIPHYPIGLGANPLYSDFSYLSAAASSLFLACLLVTYVSSYLANQILESRKKIEALSNARIDFINLVMHEEKSPLTSIIGYADLLADQKLGELPMAHREPIAVIKRQAMRILGMVNDLLNLSRIESGKTKLDLRPVNLAEIAANVIEEQLPVIDENQLILTQEFDPRTPAVNADEDKIAEVITNLLSNAIKFSRRGGRLIVSLATTGKEAIFSVRDEGIGIESVDLPHIFEKFYRASKESAERKGTGLGLALSKSIVELHGGRIWAVSAGRDKGAVFNFALPL